ncbi:MAG: SoxR reducing system RseC family protein [Phycisphaerae bacterium]|jgi:superfamily II RNA helicase
MDQQQCQNCGQRQSCEKVYEQLGRSKGPKVLLKVIQAFLLPLILFIFSLAAAERLLTEKLKSEAGKNLTAFAAAVLVVFLYLAILKIWRRKN